MVEIKSVKNAEKFAKDIQELVREKRLSYLDAVIYYCDLKGIEVESVASLIKGNPCIKSKIQEDAEELNFLPKSCKLFEE